MGHYVTASPANAIGNEEVTAVSQGARFDYVATSLGNVYLGEHNTPDGGDTQWRLIGNVGSSVAIVNIRHLFSDATHEYVWAYAADGSFYVSADDGRTWSFRGNVLTGQTPIVQESWGKLKAQYRH